MLIKVGMREGEPGNPRMNVRTQLGRRSESFRKRIPGAGEAQISTIVTSAEDGDTRSGSAVITPGSIVGMESKFL